MTQHDALVRTPPRAAALPARLAEAGVGFAYWLVFLLVLEPGNLIRDAQAGARVPPGLEAARIVVAALMGAAVTPLLLALTRRFPIEGARLWRHGLILLLAVGALALALIVISCFPAAWLLQRRSWPSASEIGSQLGGNWLLLIYCMGGFIALVHAVRARSAPAAAEASETQIVVGSRGRVDRIALADIDWIEAQGNYVALHAGGRTHLIREQIGGFGDRLDPHRFIRIHRRTIVAVDRIDRLRPLANGDAVTALKGGQELRVSRSYRKTLAERLAE